MSIEQVKKETSLISGNERSFWSVRKTVITAIVYLIVPLIFFITASRLTHAKGPYWLPYDYENPYADFFNVLLILHGEAPEYVEHPGTTTQIFGAVVLRSASRDSQEDLIRSALEKPEHYIGQIQLAVSAFTFLCLWLSPWVTALLLRNYWVGLLIQAPWLLSPSVLYYALFPGSDFMVMPFTVMATCLCALMIAPSFVRKQLDILFGAGLGHADQVSMGVIRIPLLPILAALICALGIATKLTFFPLILISLFCCRKPRNLVWFIISFLISLAIVLIPIYSKLSRVTTWIFSLGVHSGIYGQGPVGLPGPGQYLDAIQSLLQAEPLAVAIPLAVGVGAIALSFRNRANTDSPRISWRTALPVLLIQVASFLVVAKHPAPHYLIPLCLSAGFSLALLFFVLQTSKTGILGRSIAWTMLAGPLFIGLVSLVLSTPDTYQTLRKHKVELVRLYKHARLIAQHNTLVEYYSSDAPEFAQSYGDGYARRVFGPNLAKLYPNALFFNPYGDQFETFTSVMDPKPVLEQYDHLYFLGNPNLLHKSDALDPTTFETIDQAEGFYLQKWTRK